jgi:hypothetical protein
LHIKVLAPKTGERYREIVTYTSLIYIYTYVPIEICGDAATDKEMSQVLASQLPIFAMASPMRKSRAWLALLVGCCSSEIPLE